MHKQSCGQRNPIVHARCIFFFRVRCSVYCVLVVPPPYTREHVSLVFIALIPFHLSGEAVVAHLFSLQQLVHARWNAARVRGDIVWLGLTAN